LVLGGGIFGSDCVRIPLRSVNISSGDQVMCYVHRGVPSGSVSMVLWTLEWDASFG
jgi:hypothetical protein